MLGKTYVKTSGDYKFIGECVSVFTKKSGVKRVVLENEWGLLFIFNENQIKEL